MRRSVEWLRLKPWRWENLMEYFIEFNIKQIVNCEEAFLSKGVSYISYMPLFKIR